MPDLPSLAASGARPHANLEPHTHCVLPANCPRCHPPVRQQLPGKENAKRRQALNKRIRKLAGGNGADARDSTNANAKGGRGTRAHPEENQAKEDAATAKPETSLNRRRSRGKRNQKDAASADTDESGTVPAFRDAVLHALDPIARMCACACGMACVKGGHAKL